MMSYNENKIKLPPFSFSNHELGQRDKMFAFKRAKITIQSTIGEHTHKDVEKIESPTPSTELNNNNTKCWMENDIK